MKDWDYILGKAITKAERCLQLDILLRRTEDGKPWAVETNDNELRGRRFYAELGPPSKYEEQVKAFHSTIYKARGQEVYRMQRGICALCGKAMAGTYNTETDHIESRGAHGRDDQLRNLRAVHAEPCHRLRHRPPPNMKGKTDVNADT